MKDLVIIGYGAAGFASLIEANELGIKPVLIGYGPIGGTCVNVGCVPSKRLLHLGEKGRDFFSSFEDTKQFVNRSRKEKYEDVLSYYDVELIEGKAHFISPHEVKVGDKVIEGKKFIIATGSSPFIPEIPGLKDLGYWTNVEALNPDRKISSLVIIGGRAEALEFSQMYRNFGVEVAILQRSKTLIPDWEPEISLEIQKVLEEKGIYVVTDVKVKEVKKGEGGKVVVTNKGEVEAEEILMATGRKPNVDLNLSSAGVELNEKGGIKVNDELQTTNPNIYAAGDVIGDKMLEALAGYEGTVAVRNAIKGEHKKIDFLSVPQVIFTRPNLARVGLNSFDGDFDSRTVKMKDIVKAQIIDEEKGLIKMVVEKGSKRIMGVHVMAENAAEFIGEAALAIKHRMTIDDIIDTVHVFPTVAESLRIVALAFYKDVKKLSCCV
ncbi:mercuric reductase [Acidianus hospitalis W1]|uniref:Mercuric reductase n=1 Tax=Acidianus hospitalis (strain W1) TaxID=933801 RepID=F4B6G8_ACIHW|nr:mercury(II) reductase [Acidianus hospitalis]AEE94588.1 mercuric reductase [Acidianus hospitalis W1]